MYPSQTTKWFKAPLHLLRVCFFFPKKQIKETRVASSAVSSWSFYHSGCDFPNVDKMTFLLVLLLHRPSHTTLSVTYSVLLFCSSHCCSLEVIVLWDVIIVEGPFFCQKIMCRLELFLIWSLRLWVIYLNPRVKYVLKVFGYFIFS